MSEVLRIENLHKSYAGVEVLKGIDLSIAQGETIVISAPAARARARCCVRSTFSKSRRAAESIWSSG